MNSRFRQIASYAVLTLLLVLAFVPIFMMLSMSLRKSIDIFGDFWGAPWPPRFGNFANAFRLLFLPAVSSLWIALASVAGIQ